MKEYQSINQAQLVRAIIDHVDFAGLRMPKSFEVRVHPSDCEAMSGILDSTLQSGNDSDLTITVLVDGSVTRGTFQL